MPSGDVEAMWRARDAQVPMGHMGDAWDVANAALFLASDESKYVTGIELVVDGGITCKAGASSIPPSSRARSATGTHNHRTKFRAASNPARQTTSCGYGSRIALRVRDDTVTTAPAQMPPANECQAASC